MHYGKGWKESEIAWGDDGGRRCAQLFPSLFKGDEKPATRPQVLRCGPWSLLLQPQTASITQTRTKGKSFKEEVGLWVVRVPTWTNWVISRNVAWILGIYVLCRDLGILVFVTRREKTRWQLPCTCLLRVFYSLCVYFFLIDNCDYLEGHKVTFWSTYMCHRKNWLS